MGDQIRINGIAHSWASTKLKVAGQRYSGIGQVRMAWHKTELGWRFNLRSTEVAEGYPQGQFVSLEHYLGSSELFGH